MNRIDRIKAYIHEKQQTLPEGDSGVTAMEVANALGIWRNDASKDLNFLVKEGYLSRTATRPVYFSLNNAAQHNEPILNARLSEKYAADTAAQEEQLPVQPHHPIDSIPVDKPAADSPILPNLVFERNDGEVLLSPDCEESAFESCIGYNGSLRLQIRTAKAASVYPPYGLHTLIVGETGVGKTMMAKCIHQHMKAVRKDPGIPFISFNCAEYADNPQLLLSQLFGYEKGAFTGANTTKDGLISEANGGILLLDEIHRLSPVGQEMFFSVIDHGKYRRLGGYTSHTANLMIIGATTENISSALLTTFNRRFPMTIRIPSLDERPLCERLDMILKFFHQEVCRFSVPLRITTPVIKLLLGYKGNANVGHLKNTIQICCARGYYRCQYEQNAKNDGCVDISIYDIARDIIASYSFPEQINRYCNNILKCQDILIKPEYTMEDILKQLNQDIYFFNKQYSGFFLPDGDLPGPSERLKEYIQLQQEQQGKFIDYVLGAIPNAFVKFSEKLVKKAQEQTGTVYNSDTSYLLAYILYEIINCANGGQIFTSECFVSEGGFDSPELAFFCEQAAEIQNAFGVQPTRNEMMLLATTLLQNRLPADTACQENEVKTPTITLLLAIRGSNTTVTAASFINQTFNKQLACAFEVRSAEAEAAVSQEIEEYLDKNSAQTGAVILTNLPTINETAIVRRHPNLNVLILNKYNTYLALEIAQQITSFDPQAGELDTLFSGIRNISYIGELILPDNLLPKKETSIKKTKKI